MESSAKEYAIASSIIIAAVCIAELFLTQNNTAIIIVAIAMICAYPCVVIGLYMVLEGKGEHAINGVDWSSMNKEQTSNFVHFWGIFFTLGSAMLTVSLALLMSYMVPGILLMVAGIIVMLLPMAFRERVKNRKFVMRSRGTKIAVFAVVSIAVIAPALYLMNTDQAADAVKIEFGNDSFRVIAPMVDETFEYDLVVAPTLDPDFDRGYRVWGYATHTIGTGQFNNAAFGNYTLASYTQVDPCVFFEYKGKYFAFNQSSAELTEKAYEELLKKL